MRCVSRQYLIYDHLSPVTTRGDEGVFWVATLHRKFVVKGESREEDNTLCSDTRKKTGSVEKVMHRFREPLRYYCPSPWKHTVNKEHIDPVDVGVDGEVNETK